MVQRNWCVKSKDYKFNWQWQRKTGEPSTSAENLITNLIVNEPFVRVNWSIITFFIALGDDGLVGLKMYADITQINVYART